MSNPHAVPTSASLAKRAKKDDTDVLNTDPKSVLKMDESEEDEEGVARRDPFKPHVLAVVHASDEESTRIEEIIVHTSQMVIDAESSGDADTGSKGGRYRCQDCRVSFLRDGFLLSDEQADWCGKLYGVCIEHRPAEIKEGMFRKIVRNRWQKRSYEFMGKSAREYTSCYARAQSYIEAAEEHKHLAARKRHLHVVDLAKLMAFGMANAYVHATQGTKQVYDVLLRDYELACNALAKKLHRAQPKFFRFAEP
jgi:hypothetical protein